MHNSKSFEWLLVWIFLAVVSASAQDKVLPLPETLLRVTAPSLSPKPIIGTLVQSTEGEFVLALANSELRSIPHIAVMRLEWSRGRRGHAGKGMLWGSLIGGTALAVTMGAQCDVENCKDVWAVSFLLGACLGGLVGAGLGAEIRTEDWVEVSLTPFTMEGTSEQDKWSPLPGAYLRVTAPTLSPERIIGTLVQSTENELVLALPGSERRYIPRSTVTYLELSRGQRGHVGRGMLWGALIGGTALSVVGVREYETGGFELDVFAEYLLVGAGLGTLVGAGVGAMVRTEDWEEIAIANVGLTMAPINRGAGMCLVLAW